MRISNPGKLLKTDVDDLSQGFEQLTVWTVMRLRDGGHPRFLQTLQTAEGWRNKAGPGGGRL